MADRTLQTQLQTQISDMNKSSFLTTVVIAFIGLSIFAISSSSQSNVENAHSQESDLDAKLKEMGFELPPTSSAVGIYKSVVVVDNMVYLAGHIPRDEKGEIMRGKVGDNVTLEQAQKAAQRSGLAMLASIKAELGSLNKIKRLVKTTGMVNCTPDFIDQPKVVNGCSQLFKDLFGDDAGVGARAAVGMNSLPAGSIVEIEAIFELAD